MTSRSDSAAQVLEFVRGLPLFCGTSEASLNLLASACRFRRVSRGEILFFISDPCECAYVVRSGAVSVVLNSPDGREMLIDEVHPGEMLGEVELLTGKAYSAGARAHSHCELLIVPSETFLCVVDREPALARLLLDLTARRLQKSTRRQMDLAFLN